MTTPKARAQEALLPCRLCKSGAVRLGRFLSCSNDKCRNYWYAISEEYWGHPPEYVAQAIPEADTKEARAYAELRKSFQAVIIERDEARAALKRNQWVLTKAAACMLKPDNGITDTVWLSNGTTLYDHLCCEIDGIENIVTGNVEHDIESLEKHPAAVKRGEV